MIKVYGRIWIGYMQILHRFLEDAWALLDFGSLGRRGVLKPNLCGYQGTAVIEVQNNKMACLTHLHWISQAAPLLVFNSFIEGY